MTDGTERVRISTRDVHQALGLFVSTYEKYCERMRWCYRVLLKKRGLIDYDMGNILLYDEAFTARPLSRCLRAAFRHLYGSHQEIVKEIDSICSKFENEIIPKRNDLVHGQSVWHSSINFSIKVDEDDGGNDISRQLTRLGEKRKLGKDGITIRKLPELQELVDLIKEIARLETRLLHLIAFGIPDRPMDAPSFLGKRYSS